ncbi:MAG: ATP-dependent metallopeptidase FtsH/Yme1/Tma family protein, partial [Metallibacterium scheffleri]
MNDMAKNLVLWLVIAVVLLAVFQSFSPSGRSTDAMSYTSFVQQVDSNNVGSVTISAGMPPTITGKLRDGSALRTVAPAYDSDLVTRLLKHDVQVTQVPADGGNILVKILIDWVPILLIFGVLFWFMRQMQSGG